MDNKIKCLSLAVSFLATQPIKLELHISGELLIANHLDQSSWWTNQKYWTAVRSNSLHSFWEVHNYIAQFTSHGMLHEFGAKKPISWAKPAHFVFFAINFTAWSHILSTDGDALTHNFPHFEELYVKVPPLLRLTEMLIRQGALHIPYKILQFLYFFTYFTKHKNSLLAMNYIPSSVLWM
jgi:hypothetical protein